LRTWSESDGTNGEIAWEELTSERGKIRLPIVTKRAVEAA